MVKIQSFESHIELEEQIPLADIAKKPQILLRQAESERIVRAGKNVAERVRDPGRQRGGNGIPFLRFTEPGGLLSFFDAVGTENDAAGKIEYRGIGRALPAAGAGSEIGRKAGARYGGKIKHRLDLRNGILIRRQKMQRVETEA